MVIKGMGIIKFIERWFDPMRKPRKKVFFLVAPSSLVATFLSDFFRALEKKLCLLSGPAFTPLSGRATEKKLFRGFPYRDNNT